MIVLRQLLQLAIFKIAMVHLGERNLLLYSPLFDFLQPIIYTIFISRNIIVTSKKNGNKSKSFR